MIKIQKNIKAPTLFIKPSHSGDEKIEWLFRENNLVSNRGVLNGYDQLVNLNKYAVKSEVVLIIAGEATIFHEVDIPGGEKVKISQKLLKAMPYWLEEKIIGDVETLEWVLVTAQAPYKIMGVNKSLLADWDTRFKAAQLPLHRIIPDVLCLPVPAVDEWNAIPDGNRWILRMDAGSGMVIDDRWINTLLKRHETGRVVRVFGEGAREILPPGWLRVTAGDTFENLVLNSDSTAVNVVTKPVGYRDKKQKSSIIRTLLLATVASALILMMILVKAGYQHAVANNMEKQTQQIYREIFQGGREMKNPRYHLMKILKNADTSGSDDRFISLFSILAESVKNVNDLNINEIVYVGSESALYISGPPESVQKLYPLIQGDNLNVKLQAPDDRPHNPASTVWIKMERAQ